MRKALIVGINDYGKASLKCCVNDANAVALTIERDGDGSPNFDIRKLTDFVTKADLKRNIKELFTGDSEMALFYFSGHGHFDDLGGYIVTSDYRKDDVGISMDEIMILVNQSKAKNKIIILDCCHSGALGATGSEGKSIGLGPGVSILTASKDDQFAYEIKGHGVYTHLLLGALQGGAADLLGRITPGSIYSYIDQSLGPWGQRPVFKTNIDQFKPIKTITPSISMDLIRKLPSYFPKPEDQFDLDPSFEFTNDPAVQHEYRQPYANKSNVQVFKDLQKLVSAGLVVPFDEQHMYFAAMNSKGCELTALGLHYWRLVNDKRI